MKKLYVVSLTLSLLISKISLAQITGTNDEALNTNNVFINKNKGFVALNENNARQQHGNFTYSLNKYVELQDGPNNKIVKTLVAPTGIEYDVKYYRLELRINPDTSVGKYIKGKVTTYFKTTIANFTQANFDFATPLTCDSVYYHGVKLAAVKIVRPTDLLQITLPAIAILGTLDSVSVWYKGVPPSVAGFSNGTGYVKSTHNSGANNYVYTLSEPYSSYTWWPCKSFIVSDKADSMDMIVSTPLLFKTAGNGTLVSETTVGSNIFTYWKERYPIAAYQVCTAVANYVQYPAVADTVIIGGTKMPIYNYLFPETNTANAHTSLDRVKLMITTFNSLYGDYPFKKEKYGNYTFGFGGGMEHNTFSGESATGVYDQPQYWDILAHELGHQWWGDNVTNGSWQDIWVHESFADYSEILCAEFAPSVAASAGNTGLSWRQNQKNVVMNTSNQVKTTYVTDTSTILTIFTPAVYIYERGGMIISMLRTLLGDANFFQALKNYQSDPLLKMGSGITADVKRHMEALSGLNLTTFFNNWMYNTGFANYNAAKWNNAGKQIVLQLPQTTQLSALAHFDMPLSIRIQGSNGVTMDTTVIVYDAGGFISYDNNGVLTSTGSNIVQYNLSYVPVTITFDALSQTLANGVFTKNPGLGMLATSLLNFTGDKVSNNAKLLWAMDKAADFDSFSIERSTDGISFSSIGTTLAKTYPGMFDFSFTDKNMQPGNNFYRIKIIQKEGTIIYSKTILLFNTTDNSGYSVTPNPASNYIIIKGSITEKVTIKIYDENGKLIKKLLNQTLANNNLIKVFVNEFIAGNYFVEIQSANTGRHTKQIVVIK